MANSTFVTNKNLYILKPKNNRVDLRLVLGIVNSRLYSHLYASRISGAVKDDFPQVTITDFVALPCPVIGRTMGPTAPGTNVPAPIDVPSTPQARIADLVEQVLAAKARGNDTDTAPLEAEIDQLVYKLYGLTDEEIATVEGRGPASEANARPSTPVASSSRKSTAAKAASSENEVLE